MTDNQFNQALKMKNQITALKGLYHWVMSEDKISLLQHYTEIDLECVHDDLALAIAELADKLQKEFDEL